MQQLVNAIAKAVGQTEPVQERAETAVFQGNDVALPNVALAINPRTVKELRDDDAREDGQQMAWRVVNAQAGGTVAHRVGMLPLLLGNQLVEISVAFFE